MPWKDTTAMDQKLEFIYEWLTKNYTITELCETFEISRPTGYRLIQRYETMGIKGLVEQSRAPSNHPNRTADYMVQAILDLKKKHDKWGAKKIHRLLYNYYDYSEIPTMLTVHNILSRNGLVCPQRRLRRVKPVYPIFDPQECNEVWSADYKGKFRMGNKKYCHPLTISDSKSRYLFTAKGMYRENFQSAKQEFTRVFRLYGLPKQIHTDNGSPFGSTTSIQRFTRLSYWFIDLGILPVFSDPSHPEQNGRHERMHRDLKASCASPPCFDMKVQQRKMNSFVREYNEVRPHEALGLETPGSFHKQSKTPFPERIRDYDYPSHMKVMNVTKNGAIRWKSYYWVFLSNGLIGKQVAAEEIGNGIWKVFYRNVFLGYFSEMDLKTKQQATKLTTKLV